MNQTLDSLNDRLSPRSLINNLMDWFEKRDRSSSHDVSRKPKQLARFVRDNPVPALLTGIGAAWLIAESQSDDDEADFEPFQLDHDPVDDRVASNYGRNFGEGSDGEGDSVTDKLKDTLGDTTDAMSSAVSAARDKFADTRDQIADRGGREKSTIKNQAARGRRSAVRASDQLQLGYADAEDRFKEAVDDYPLGFGAGFLGLGLLAGLLLPRSEAEDEWFGESADEIKDAVTDKGEELLERGKEVADRAKDMAIERV